jgi:polysaccharide export outer membrane protein
MMNQPPAAYVLGPDDMITIQALDLDEVSNKPMRIDTSGYINLPLVGRLRAADLTLQQLEAELNERLKTYAKDPRVVVSVSEFRSQPVSIMGYVHNAGVHQIEGRKTLVEVLSKAGGPRPEAGPIAKITRRQEYGSIPLPNAVDDQTGRFSIAEVNLKALIDGMNPEENIPIKPHDVISVPKADVVYVIGEVKKTGGFVLSQKQTISVIEALAMAEGLNPLANRKRAEILRIVPGQTERMHVPVDLKQVLSGKATNIAMQAEDILFVPTNAKKAITSKVAESAIGALTSVAIWGALY